MGRKRQNAPTALVKVRGPRSGILRCAVFSRCLVIVISAVSNYIIPDHQATDVFIRPEEHEANALDSFSAADNFIKFVLGGLARWDAQHFLHIAEHGYIFESSLAFFPLFPFLVRCLASVLEYFFSDVLTKSSILLLSSTTINFAGFVAAADTLYTISLRVLDDLKLAYISAILFCFNPASIFFSAAYSETLYALLSFSGIRFMFRDNRDVWSSIMFGLSACTRSNGVLNIGFILYKKLKFFFTVLWPALIRQKLTSKPFLCLKEILVWVLSILVSSVLALIPFFAFQVDAYDKFCTPKDVNLSHTLMNYAVEHNVVLPSSGGKNSRPTNHWCHHEIPLAYSYVQNHYWNVGYLKYFEILQIPNFLLAFPIIVLIFSQGLKFFNQHKALCMKLGFVGKQVTRKYDTFKTSREMFVFVVHAVSLTVFCFFCIHVQVTTRMIFSASPVPYWFGAYLFQEGFEQMENMKKTKAMAKRSGNGNSWRSINSISDIKNYVATLSVNLTLSGKLLVVYFLFYFVVGTVLFSNFLPWT